MNSPQREKKMKKKKKTNQPDEGYYFDSEILSYSVGVRYIPLRSLTGVEMPHSGLFVRMKLQDFDPPSRVVKGTSRERLLTF